MRHHQQSEQRQPHGELAGEQAVVTQAVDEQLWCAVEQLHDALDLPAWIGLACFLLGLRLATAQGLAQAQVVIAAVGFVGRLLRIGTGAGHVLADGVLQIRVALEAKLLAELHHAGLADAERAGQLLGGVVAQQVGVVEDEVGDAALDGRHLPTLGADLQQGRHAGCPGVCKGVAVGRIKRIMGWVGRVGIAGDAASTSV